MKPVAYIDRQDLERLPHHDCWVNGQEHKNSVPLYTHPVNLTSLEIADAMELVFGEQIEEQFGNDLEEFARAILRKAQEK
jgi:hypothetical protein